MPLPPALLRLAGLVLLALVTACGGKEEPRGPGARAGGGAPVKVNTVQVSQVEWIDEIEALGTTSANESVTLTAKVTETVERVNFEDGDIVELGAVLVELTGKGEIAALKEAQAGYAEAQKQYQRLEGLVTQGTVPRSQLDTQIGTRDALRARMEAIRARLSDRVITAPFAGVLGFRRVSPGTLVSPGTEITTLDDVRTLKLDFSVPESFLGAIAVGAPISARSSAWPGQAFAGTVRSIESRVDPLTRAVTVRAHLDNADLKLKPGMLLSVRLTTPPRQTLAIDEIALLQMGTQAFVFKVDAEQKAQRIDVLIGSRRAGRVEIVSGLSAGDQVISDGTVKVRPGMPVNVQTAQIAVAPTEPAPPPATPSGPPATSN